MPKGYRPYLPDQDLLLPPSLRDWVAEEHLVYFVSDVVDQLDLSAIHAGRVSILVGFVIPKVGSIVSSGCHVWINDTR
jgi:hypothetical protein